MSRRWEPVEEEQEKVAEETARVAPELHADQATVAESEEHQS